jgi:hypothetical protein
VGTRAAVINPDGSFDFHSKTIKMRLQKKTWLCHIKIDCV